MDFRGSCLQIMGAMLVMLTARMMEWRLTAMATAVLTEVIPTKTVIASTIARVTMIVMVIGIGIPRMMAKMLRITRMMTRC